MDAHDFSAAIGQGKKFTFGADSKGWSRTLREMADSIDLGEINPQQVTIWSKSAIDDFTMTTIVLKFAEKVDMDERKINRVCKKLWGPDSQFPVAVAEVK